MAGTNGKTVVKIPRIKRTKTKTETMRTIAAEMEIITIIVVVKNIALPKEVDDSPLESEPDTAVGAPVTIQTPATNIIALQTD